MQNPPTTGKNSRLPAAEIAAACARLQSQRTALRNRRQLALFAQFPPAALFTTLRRAVSRRPIVGRGSAPSYGTTVAFPMRRRFRGVV
jgi:hypothetical protein